jgi:hypothetical protein
VNTPHIRCCFDCGVSDGEFCDGSGGCAWYDFKHSCGWSCPACVAQTDQDMAEIREWLRETGRLNERLWEL